MILGRGRQTTVEPRTLPTSHNPLDWHVRLRSWSSSELAGAVHPFPF
jgi:hypothetical protein